MAPIDIVVLAAIGVAFVAVCVRIYRKGTCADCAQGGVCTGHCSNKKTCAALKGVDKIAEDLGRGIQSQNPVSNASRASVRGAFFAFGDRHGE